MIVKRVTGQSLRRFADSALFKPLGMDNTLFLDDHNEIVPRRASAYQPGRGGYKIDVWNNDIVGQGGIVTTIADLQKWDENFYTARVGGPSFIRLIQTVEPLNDGRDNHYAFGLTMETYRGQRLVQHTGSTGGYRAAIYRFPDLHTSVAMLCNVTTANTTALSLAMADAVLASRLGPRESASMPIGRKRSHRLTGELLVPRFASEGEQPIAPRGCKYGGNYHDSILLLPALPGRIMDELSHIRASRRRHCLWP
jgi:CubicO group peptidase (beta-lactamase class C family)